jgi:hypothetical protein
VVVAGGMPVITGPPAGGDHRPKVSHRQIVSTNTTIGVGGFRNSGYRPPRRWCCRRHCRRGQQLGPCRDYFRGATPMALR